MGPEAQRRERTGPSVLETIGDCKALYRIVA